MFMWQSNKNRKNPGIRNVFLHKMSIVWLAGLLLVGCGKETLVERISQAGKPSLFKTWAAGDFSINLTQGYWRPGYEIIDNQEFYFYEAQFTVTLVDGTDICFYDAYFKSKDQSAGTMDLSHYDPICDFGLVKWSLVTENPYGLNGLHLSIFSDILQ